MSVDFIFTRTFQDCTWSVYNIGGELVAKGQSQGEAVPTWTVPRLSDGIYLVDVRLEYSDGNNEIILKKLALIR
jgi:hypothetical protein